MGRAVYLAFETMLPLLQHTHIHTYTHLIVASKIFIVVFIVHSAVLDKDFNHTNSYCTLSIAPLHSL